MKSFQILSAMLLWGGLASAQQYTISTIAGIPQVQGCFGDGEAATSGQLDKPTRVTVDSKGNIYFIDSYSYIVRMVTASSGDLSTIAGNGTYGSQEGSDDGFGNCQQLVVNGVTNSQIGVAQGIAVDNSGNVFVADTSNFVIRKVDAATNMTTFAGNGTRGYAGDGGAASAAAMWFPSGLAFDKSGNLYVADYGSATVRKIDSSGKISTVAGSGSWGYSGDGGPASKAALASPLSVAVDAAGNIFIGDTGNNNIRKITTDGNIHTIVTNVSPASMVVDGAGNLFFVDGVNPAVWEAFPSGALIAIAGNGRTGYGGDGGQATLAELDHPNGIAIDSAGNLYVSDTNNEIIRKLTPVPFSVGAAVNSASGAQGAIAPGEIVTLYGSGIGPSALTTFSVSNGFIGSQIANTSVTFNGVAAPLIYASSGLVSAIVPYEVAGLSTANVAVTYQGNTSAATVLPVTNAAPGIFTLNMTGAGQAAAVNQDGTINSASNPAKAGSVISLYLTGEGQTSPAGVDGKLANAAPYPKPVLPVTATIGGQNAVVSYYGAAPTAVAGLMQVNVQIPAGVAAGGAVPVTVNVGPVAAQTGVTLSISN
ncbi:MAG: hypothetical protein KGN84_10730 [Acidobacteriota bacterium]|nr:hypothetical protein [Acidobacteriota bacterium]